MTKHSESTQNATCDNNVLANRLFRGFSAKHNNWIYGDLIHTPEKRMRIINYTDISSDGVDNFVTINEMVETRSVGQCVGLFDIKADQPTAVFLIPLIRESIERNPKAEFRSPIVFEYIDPLPKAALSCPEVLL